MALLDSNKPAEQIMTDLINLKNSSRPSFKPHPYGRLRFRNVTKARYDQDYDTIVEVSDQPAPQDTDWVQFFYTRGSITQVLNRKRPAMPYKPEYTSLFAMLDDVNAHFGIQLTEEDVEDTAIEAGEYPITVPVHVKADALVYRGASAIYLEDPNTGVHIITEGDTGLADVSADFREGNVLLLGESNPGVDFWVAENGEAQLAAAVVIDGATSVVETLNGDFPLALDATEQWRVLFSAGLIDDVNGGNYLNQYRTTLTIRRKAADAQPLAELSLTRAGSVIYLVDHQRGISISQGLEMFLDGRVIQGSLSPAHLPSIFEGSTRNAAGGVLGGFVFELKAERQGEAAKVVNVAITTETQSVARLNTTIATPVNSLQLLEEGDQEIPVTVELRVVGPAGEAVSLSQPARYTVELTEGAELTITPARDVTLNNAELIVPAGLQKGYYPIQGTVKLPLGWDYDAANTIELALKQSDAVVSEASWALQPLPPSPPSVAAVVVEGAFQVGQGVRAVPQSVFLGNPRAAVTVAWFADDVAVGAPVDVDGPEDLELTLAAAQYNKSITARYTLTNASGSVSVTSAAVGPVLGVVPTLGSVAVSGSAVEGQTLTAALNSLNAGTPAGTTEVSWRADGVEIVRQTAAPYRYTLTAAEVGKRITAAATVTNAAGNVTRTSSQTAAVAALEVEEPGDGG